MKGLLRSFVFYAVSFALVAYFFPGLSYRGDLTVLLQASVAFGLLALFIRPIINVLMLPINFLTLGLFSWVVNLVILYLVTRFVPDFNTIAFQFEGFSYQGFVIPAIYLNVLWSAVVSSLTIGFVSSFLHWLVH
jgi:putative membrane protein